MIEEAVLQRTLHRALAHGGDFAEVFAEDRSVVERDASTTAKVEELVSGRERGAGIRVVRGETTGYAHTADLSEDGPGRGGRGRGRGGRAPAGPAPPSSPLDAADRRRRRTTSTVLPGDVAKARKAEVLERADDAARVRERLDPPGHASATPTPAAGSSWPTPTACSSRTTRCAPASS